jgi:hypothetical protein
MSRPSWCHLSRLLELYPTTINEVESTILALRTTYPWIQTQINSPDGPWPAPKPYYVHKSHIITEDENYRMAVDNIALTGRNLGAEEDKYLRFLLCYPSGWSATSPLHHNDSWIHYIRYHYPHINKLQPILDDMTWPEEIPLLAGDHGPGSPAYILFANLETFYIYEFDGNSLFRVGNTLKEVYHGLLERRLDSDEAMSFLEPDNGEDYHIHDYFPLWRHEVTENGEDTHVLTDPIIPFIPHPENFDDSGYISEGEE